MLIILLPGMDGTGQLFEPFTKQLPANILTKIVSYPPHTHLSYPELESFVVQQLPDTGKYIIVAESYSGPIALRIAARGYPDLVAVVLVASFAHRPLGWIGSIVARLPLRLLFRISLPDPVLRTYLLGDMAPASCLKAFRQALRCVDSSVLAARLRQALTVDFGDKKIYTTTRVVCIFAEDDRLLSPASRKEIAQLFPNMETEIVRAPHLALQSAPAAILSALNRRDILPHEIT